MEVIGSKTRKPELLVVLPGYNEEEQIEGSARKVFDYCSKYLENDYDWKILLADSGSTDSTPQIIKKLVKENEHFLTHREEIKGRGRILKNVWIKFPFDISIYMDMDLSTDLRYIKEAVDAVRDGAHLAIGSRHKKGSKVVGRRLLREITSRGYVFVADIAGLTKITDYQCGFKAISKKLAMLVLPFVENNNWFFDTELIFITKKAGFSIEEIPVLWTDDPGSTVNIKTTIIEDLKGLQRILRNRPWLKLHLENKVRASTLFDYLVEFLKFLLVGGLSTLVNWVIMVLFLIIVPIPTLFSINIMNSSVKIKNYAVGAILGYLLSAIFNFLANKKFTFANRSKSYIKQLLVFFTIALTGMLLNVLITTLLVEKVGISPFFVTPFAAAVVVIWNFTCNRFITFGRF